MNVPNVFCLNPKYSTTRIVTEEWPRIENDPSSKVQRTLFLPSHPQRKAEGGLRTKGYFKRHSEDKPLVTVITIVHNGAAYIEKTIQSVLNQTYNNVEYIIIDGDSTDGTAAIIKKYEQVVDYWVSEPDLGISDAFNKGVTAATGTWINFMNCADRFASPDGISYLVANRDHGADIIFGKAHVMDEKGNVLLTAGRAFDNRKFVRRMTIPHQSAFHSRRYFEQFGLFDKKLKVGMVYELLRRKKRLSTVFVDQIISTMLAGGAHEAEDYLRLKEARMVKRKYCSSSAGSIIIEFDYCHALVRALIKRALNRIGLSYVTRKIRQIEGRLK